MHVYSQWGMERMCGMITRTAKSRVDANRNMEITLLLTEQKHMLGYVLNDSDWPMHERNITEHDSSDDESDAEVSVIEDADGNLSLAKAFRHRIAVSRPEPVRDSIRIARERFSFIGRIQSREPTDLERRRIRGFMSGLQNYDEALMRQRPTQITIWRWCRFRDEHDNKKEDFKVTSRTYRRANNVRNASLIAYKNSYQEREYAEVQFFFQARLPAELVEDLPGNVESDSEEERTGESVHHLALVRKIPVVVEGLLVRKTNNTGALAVISASSMVSLIGSLKVGNEEYLTARFTSMLGQVH